MRVATGRVALRLTFTFGHASLSCALRERCVERWRPNLTAKLDTPTAQFHMESLHRLTPHIPAGERHHRRQSVCPPTTPATHHGPKETLPKLMLGAIGVVYGDIGTSPLYTMKESFLGPHPLAVDHAAHLRRPQPHLLDADDDRHVQICRRRNACRQSRRRRFVRLAVADRAQSRGQEEVDLERW